MILLSPHAARDIERLREFIEVKDKSAAKRALLAIWNALERLEEFPDLGRPTEDDRIRQIVIRFGNAGYVCRYVVMPDTADIFILRIWHGREARP
ncbi:type II toxin-antitoxin system RelE/ParE family toxin [Pseudorhodoplanes sp.]|uniref:type II toxin-antitoxin system RelE/ParE family toxin n=1 Tax=Pseudorhodoplanes sp. TaxID=1934341 RepID=UPI002BBEDF26|nr:type II toxin-antitoxin system RelE/ParE family toxin [Pseudorhodoplanes sp.]HWV54590.1 type II toxin-antitoxin system RelE/ParE family toxin [Pseudorhodoplanes sp.]